MKEKGAREIALEVLYKVEEKGAYSNVQLNYVLEKYNPGFQERSLATSLVYGVLRRRNTLDWQIEQFSKRPVKKMTVWIRNILRQGVYQLLYMEKIPQSAACNEAVKLARKKGHEGVSRFVNGIMRNIARNLSHLTWPEAKEEFISVYYSHPDWLVKHWAELFGWEKTEEICRADNAVPALSIRGNRLKITAEGLQERLAAEGVASRQSSLAKEGLLLEGSSSLSRLTSYQEGLFQVQDESSMLVGKVVAPKPGERILDCCSAPGGKTTHLAELMDNQGEIIANELQKSKLTLIDAACQRLGIDIVQTVNHDGRDLSQLYQDKMDRVLLDAPCSGLGILRRKPDARWRKSLSQVKELVELQSELLSSAASCVRPGGVLVYSTCSIEPEENIRQIRDFLKKHQDFYLSDLAPYLPAVLQSSIEDKGMLQLYPGMTDGFFICRMERKK